MIPSSPDPVTTPLQSILGEINRMYSGHAWHGPAVLEAVQGITASQAAWRPYPDGHTIFELTHHIAAWIGEATSRLRGNPAGEPADGNFPPSGTTVDNASWAATLQLLERRQAGLLDAVAAFDTADLSAGVNPDRPLSEEEPGTFSALIHGVVQHNAYHTGQIMLLRRMMESSRSSTPA